MASMDSRWAARALALFLAALALAAPAHAQDVALHRHPRMYSATRASTRASGLQYKLPQTAAPTTYDIELLVDLTEKSFKGQVTIQLIAIHAVSYLTFHVDHDTLEIASADFFADASSDDFEAVTPIKDADMQTVTCKLSKSLVAGSKIKLRIRYTGKLRNDMLGLYSSSYVYGIETRYLAATQFETTYARAAFPCWDEPQYKAKFRIKIIHHKSLTALSNTATEDNPKDPTYINPIPVDYTFTHFKETPVMSSYLVAFLVSDFAPQVSEHKESTAFSVWVRPDRVSQTALAADIGARTLKQLEEYLGIAFSESGLTKLDLAAIPDFSAGAMENWGLITFRETELMYKEGESTAAAKESIAMVVAHEETHMWFGDLVSPAWWGFAWLNEGFARYFQYVSTDLAEPKWRIMDSYIVKTKMSALSIDALQSAHPMSANVFSPAEVQGVFDHISYDKGSAILHMTRNVMGDSKFKDALQSYLNEMKFTVATPRDLFRNLDLSATSIGLPSGVTLTTVLDTWTSEAGYPLISVQVNSEGTSANITQTRYFSSGSGATSSTRWWVPLTYTTSSSPNFSPTAVTWFNPSQSSLQISLNKIEWIVFNLQHTGFYRVNYDTATWKKITDFLKVATNVETINLLNRAQLLDDALNLARSHDLDYATALELTQYLVNEVDPIPWRAAISQLDYVGSLLTNTAGQSAYSAYMLSLLTKVYDKIGFDEDAASDDHLTLTFRSTLLSQACRLGMQKCVDSALAAFKSLRDSSKPVSPGARSTVYCTALRSGTTDDWDFLWKQYTASDNANERELILGALGCTKDKTKLNSYLDMTLNPSTTGVRAQDAQTVLSAVLSGNPENFDTAYDFVLKNLDKMATSSWSGTQKVIQDIADKIPTNEKLTEFENFVRSKSNRGELEVSETELTNAFETAKNNLAWRSAHLNTVSQWLATTTGTTIPKENSAAALTLWWPALLLVTVSFRLNTY